MKQVGILFAALVAALIGSYVVWTSPPDPALEVGEVAVFNPDTIDGLTWSADSVHIQGERKTDAAGEYLWFTVREEPKQVDASDSTDDAPAPTDDGSEEVEKATHSEFLGNKQARDLWDAYAPLLARRGFPIDESTDLSVFGLDEPEGTLTVEHPGGAFVLQVGGETFGSRQRYVSFEDQVVLLDSALIGPLQYAKARLYDRSLLPFVEADATRIDVVRDGDDASTWHRQNGEDPANAYWASLDEPERADETAATWIEKVFRLRSRSFQPDAPLPSADTLQLTIVVHDESRSWSIALHQHEDRWTAVTDHTRVPVELTPDRPAELFADLTEWLDR